MEKNLRQAQDPFWGVGWGGWGVATVSSDIDFLKEKNTDRPLLGLGVALKTIRIPFDRVPRITTREHLPVAVPYKRGLPNGMSGLDRLWQKPRPES